MLGVAEREDALLGARLLLVAARAAEGRVEAVFVERLAQRHRLHDVGVGVGAVVERVDVLRARPSWLVWTSRSKPSLRRHLVAEGDHLAELPGRIDMQERERRLGREERLHRQMQQHRRILAHRIEHHRIGEVRRNLAENVDRLGLQALEVGKVNGHAGALGDPSGRISVEGGIPGSAAAEKPVGTVVCLSAVHVLPTKSGADAQQVQRQRIFQRCPKGENFLPWANDNYRKPDGRARPSRVTAWRPPGPDTASAPRPDDRRCWPALRWRSPCPARRSGRSTARAAPGRCASGTAGRRAPRSPA